MVSSGRRQFKQSGSSATREQPLALATWTPGRFNPNAKVDSRVLRSMLGQMPRPQRAGFRVGENGRPAAIRRVRAVSGLDALISRNLIPRHLPVPIAHSRRLPFRHRAVLVIDPRHQLRSPERILRERLFRELEAEPGLVGERKVASGHPHRREPEPLLPDLLFALVQSFRSGQENFSDVWSLLFRQPAYDFFG